MHKKIAVEDSLSNVSQELRTFGYDVVTLDYNNLTDVNAVVISGIDSDMMNMSTIKTDAHVINARGMTAIQIKNEIDKRQL
ncbi:MAG: YkuS family protein [Halanaerobiales bacterium]